MVSTNQIELQPPTANDYDEYNISRSVLLHVLQGVVVATETSDENAKPVIHWIASCRVPGSSSDSNGETYQHDVAPTDAYLIDEWRTAIVSNFLAENDEASRQLASLALALAFLRQKSRSQNHVGITAIDLSRIWDLIHDALISMHLSYNLCCVSRSAQGFIDVPLCSLFKDDDIDELFRLHAWLPNVGNGNPDRMINSYQSFTRSWVLAGEGRNHSYGVVPLDGDYSIDAATHTALAVYTRNMTYSTPAAAYHWTEVSPDTLYATIVFFDSRMGSVKDTSVLGSKDVEYSSPLRDSGGVTIGTLVEMVHTVRLWEMFVSQGRQQSQRAEWERALQAFNTALILCESAKDFPNAKKYRQLILGELGNTNRRFGRYEQAKDMLEGALADMKPSLQSLELSVELGVVYRHMNRFADAKRALQNQYDTAKQLGFERAMCRAIGNLGMVNYQLSQQNNDHALLDLAIEQLIERVESSRHIKETIDNHKIDSVTKFQWLRDATIWESIGLSRLSLCYSASGKTKEAITAAQNSFNLTSTSEDSTIVAVTHFFYGRALFLDGQHSLALQYFNPPYAACTPAIALSKEPSDEHRQYLQELVAAGADLDLVDEQGYTALDYAVFSADTATQSIVLDGLRRALDGNVETKLAARLAEARIRKGYREVFQEKLRPVLLHLGGHGGDEGLQNLRLVYAEALAAHEELRSIFDELKFVRYSDFLRFGRLPRSSDGLTQRFISEVSSSGDQEVSKEPIDFVIFISYRWINKEKGLSSPDDKLNTQYGRIVEAMEEFLRKRRDVRREGVGLWLDHACINQDDPTPGVTALPMLLAQCDAVISLVDDKYYDRAWCSVEAMMVQTLRRSYGRHLWFVQVEQAENRDQRKGNRRRRNGY